MIDIIIPANNAHKTIRKALYSVAYQTISKDIKVYIINNGSKNGYKEEVEYFSNFLDIQELKMKEAKGTGLAREYGIKHSDSEYIVFLNPTDVFASPVALQTLQEAIKKSKADLVVSSFKEEVSERNFKQYDNASIWIYGKIYSREFLKKNKIHFNDSTINEDIGFNQLIFLHNPKMEVVNEITYIELFNEEEKQKKSSYNYYISTIIEYVKNMTWALDKADRDNCSKDQISYFTFSTLVSTYYYYLELGPDYEKDSLIREAKDLIRLYNKYPISKEAQNDIWYNEFLILTQEMNMDTILNPYISFEDFIRLIENI